MATNPARLDLLTNFRANIATFLDTTNAMRGLAERRGDLGMDHEGAAPLSVDDFVGELAHLTPADFYAATTALNAMMAWFATHPEYRAALNKVR
jgi:delta 1-pyrroline-5-carboxylate dehydrogenase